MEMYFRNIQKSEQAREVHLQVLFISIRLEILFLHLRKIPVAIARLFPKLPKKSTTLRTIFVPFTSRRFSIQPKCGNFEIRSNNTKSAYAIYELRWFHRVIIYGVARAQVF